MENENYIYIYIGELYRYIERRHKAAVHPDVRLGLGRQRGRNRGQKIRAEA